MEDSGFKVYKDFKTSQKVLDIYAILPTTMGDFGVVVACLNYDKTTNVGVDILKEMDEIGNNLKAAKVTIVTSSYFTEQAVSYATRKNIKLVDRNNLLEMAKKYSSKTQESTQSTLDSNFENREYIEEPNLGRDFTSYDNDAEMAYIENRRNMPREVQNSAPYYYKPGRSRGLFKGGSKHSSGFTPKAAPRRNNLDYYSRSSVPSFNAGGAVSELIKNPIVSVLIVILVSYALSFLLGNYLKMGTGIVGAIELFIALVLSYLLAFNAERNRFFVMKGTLIFFISLIVLIILIFI